MTFRTVSRTATVAQYLRRSARAGGRAPRSVKRSFRSGWERLEDRTLLSSITWTGTAGDNNWDTAANWSSDAVPTVSDDVVVDSSFAGTDDRPPVVDLRRRQQHQQPSRNRHHWWDPGDRWCFHKRGSFGCIRDQQRADRGLNIDRFGEPRGQRTFHVGRRRHSRGSGTLDAYGGMTIDTTTSISYLNGVTLNNHGTAAWTGLNFGGIHASNGATINNLAGATWNAQGNITLFWDSSQPGPQPAFNSWSFHKFRRRALIDLQPAFNNTGTVDVQDGTLSLRRRLRHQHKHGDLPGRAGHPASALWQPEPLGHGERQRRRGGVRRPQHPRRAVFDHRRYHHGRRRQ